MDKMTDTRILIPQLNTHLKSLHVSYDVVDEFLESIPYSKDIQQSKTNYYKDKIIEKIYNKTPSIISSYQSFRSTEDNRTHFFGVYMGIRNLYGWDSLLKSSYRSMYLFDAWIHNHDLIASLVVRLNIDLLFVSSRQAAEILKKRLPNRQILWCAEGCRPEIYKYKKYSERKIDIIQLGRRYEYIHKQLKTLPSTISYAHQNDNGSLLFPTHKGFLDGLSNSKISICVPQALTHPDVAKGIVTVTNRYFQSIASKCLILGYAPQELIDLWGYNPVIELDKDNAREQVIYILKTYKDYLPLIERNYKTLIANHTWAARWDAIKNRFPE